MNLTQELRRKFPGAEFMDLERTVAFTSQQDGPGALWCLKHILRGMDGLECGALVVRTSREKDVFWTGRSYRSRESVAAALFDLSLSRYITKLSVRRTAGQCFVLNMKVHELDKLHPMTNIDLGLVEHVVGLFEGGSKFSTI